MKDELDTTHNEEPPRSLTRRVMRMDKESLGCSATILFFPVGLGLSAIFGLGEGEVFLAAFVVAPICLMMMYSLGGRLGNLYEYAHLHLPGRHARDQRWLGAWSYEAGSFCLPLEAPQAAVQYQIPLTKLTTPFHFRELDVAFYQKLRATQRALLDAASGELRVEAQGGGYCTQLVLHLPNAWQQALALCVGEHEEPLNMWLPGALMSGEEDELIHPFMFTGWDDPVGSFPDGHVEDAVLWVVAKQDVLRQWVQARAYWRVDDCALVINRWTDARHLEKVLVKLHHLKSELWLLLARHEVPLFCQLSTGLLGRLHEFGEWASGHHMTGTRGLRWWLLLCERYQREELLLPTLHQLFLRIPTDELQELLHLAKPSLREAFLLPALCDFLLSGWLHTFEHGILLPDESDGPLLQEPDTVAIFMDEERFDAWLTALQAHLSSSSFRALCESIVAGALPVSHTKERRLISEWRQQALAFWLVEAGPNRSVQLLRWLDELEMFLKPKMIEALGYDDRAPGLEEEMHKWLFVDEGSLSPDEHQVRLAALTFLGHSGTTLSIKVLQRGLDRWDPTRDIEALQIGTHVLGKLRKELMSGAVSIFEGDSSDVGGQLSLSAQSAIEGQLSLTTPEVEPEQP